MSIDRTRLRWNGWGWTDAPDILGARAEAVWGWMARILGPDPLPHTPAAALDAAALPALRLSGADLDALRAIAGAEHVHTDAYERAFHARGKSYPDMVRLRAGDLHDAPDAVVYPGTAEAVLALVQWAAAEGVAVTPFGGGSSVVGGVTPLRGGHRAAITIDMTRLDRVLALDETARVARIEAGIYGPALEAALQARGYTLGHYPQSFEFSTLGGWIAARGAGQQSNKYGKAEKWLVSARMATPAGWWDSEGFPASAAGPQLTALVPGSEGTLGIIAEATVRIQPVPAIKDYRAYLFQTFAAGADAARALVQAGVPAAMIRLSDEDEAFFFNALQHPESAAEMSMRFAMMIVGLEGDAPAVEAARAQSRAIAEAHGGMHLGEDLGQQWLKNRFSMPYLRDPMLERGLGVDTLETATRWSNLLPLHAAVLDAIRAAFAANPGVPGGGAVVFCHLSHSYPDGASLYFTFAFARDPRDPLGQWQAVKRAAGDAIRAHGGTISHHHGAGADHAPWMAGEKGPVGAALLRALKREIDPRGTMNPGKMIP